MKKNTVSIIAGIKNKDHYDFAVERFSDVDRLLRITAFVQRFRNNILAHVRGHEKCIGDLNVTEIEDAEIFLVKTQHFINQDDKFNLLRKSLNVFADEKGLLRLKGRLEHAYVVFDTKCPILLRDDHLSS